MTIGNNSAQQMLSFLERVERINERSIITRAKGRGWIDEKDRISGSSSEESRE